MRATTPALQPLPQLVGIAKTGVASSRKALSSLYAVLAESVEAEFGPLLAIPDLSEDAVSLLSTSIEGQVDTMHDLIRTFRLYDGVGSALCGGVFVRACLITSAWGAAMARAGFPQLAPYAALPMRSCAVDMIVALVLLGKVGTGGAGVRHWAHIVVPGPHTFMVTLFWWLLPLLVHVVCGPQHASAPMLCDKSGAPRHRTECSIKTAVLQVFGEVFSEAGEVRAGVRLGWQPLLVLCAPCIHLLVLCTPVTPHQAFLRVSPIQFAIRRIVCPVILLNCTETRILLPVVVRSVLGTCFCRCSGCCYVGISPPRSARCALLVGPGCVTSLWSRLRVAMKAELAIMAHVLLLR